jgi:hypothetical protein
MVRNSNDHSLFASRVAFFEKSMARARRFQNSPFFHWGLPSLMKEGLKQLKSIGRMSYQPCGPALSLRHDFCQKTLYLRSKG